MNNQEYICESVNVNELLVLTHWLLELFSKSAFLDILVVFRLDLGEISFNPVEKALQHNSLPFLSLASRFSTLWLGHAQKSKFWDSFWTGKGPTPLRFSIFGISFGPFHFLLFFSFYCSDWTSTGLACMEQPGVVAGSFVLSFSLNFNFRAFLCISQAPFGRSLWSGHPWKDLLLLQKLTVDDADFGQKWWGRKWKKGQGSSWPVTGGTGVKGLNIRFFHLLFMIV